MPPRVTLLAGGVGGARLAAGITRTSHELTVVVNVADDTEIHGLRISPDLDTVVYTLAGVENPTAGWGRAGESFVVLETLRDLGVDAWFTLGDRDLAVHVARTAALRAGAPLSAVTSQLAAALGVTARVLPVTDDAVATVVETAAGPLAFQEYFVRRRHQDEVHGLTYEGVERATPAPGVIEAITGADVVILAPSNPLLSVEPVLAVPGVREALAQRAGGRIAVSPIVGGRALKGPAAEVLVALGHEPSSLGVARLYRGLVDTMCIDERDADLREPIEALGMTVLVTDTIMEGDAGRERLARRILGEVRPS